MDIQSLKTFIAAHPDNYSIELKRNYRLLYDEINEMFPLPCFSQKLYHYLNGKDVGKCVICNNLCQFDGFHKGYRTTCSRKCNAELYSQGKKEVRSCVICGNDFEISKRREKTTCSNICLLKLNSSPDVNAKRKHSLSETILAKYGVDHTSKIPGVQEKTRSTKLQKYGNENYVNPEKARHTKLQKYGNENYVNSEKARHTKLQKYGDENYNNREKAKRTLVDRFGTPYSPNVVAAAQKSIEDGKIGFGSQAFETTMLKKYGVRQCNKNASIVLKGRKTRLESYYSQTLFHRIDGIVVPLFDTSKYSGTKNGGFGILYPFQCCKCQNKFDDIISNGKIPQCPICYPQLRSKSQEELYSFIKSLFQDGTAIQKNTKSIITPQELDIFVPSVNVAIEFDGLYWHSEIKGGIDKNYHLDKTKKCQQLGIRLIHVFEDEWWNKKEIVKTKLTHLLGRHAGRGIYARKCELKIVESFSEKQNFLEQYHLQGGDKSSIWIGAYYNNTLVALMTFGKLRVALGAKGRDNEYELYRFCTNGQKVNGIVSKMLKFFIATTNPSVIITYADRRWSDGNAYIKSGFKLEHITPPCYWYIVNTNRYHRFNFRKSELPRKLKQFCPSLTEWENMQLNGYDRIWDCGHYKFVWTKQN